MELTFVKDREIQRFWAEGESYLDQEEAIAASIDRAARDFMARTATKKEEAGGEQLSARLRRSGDGNLVESFVRYFQAPPKDQASFNIWHHTVCEWILSVEKEMYYNVSYGKAQKILNMTFKNLYCTSFGQEKARENENFFRFCHIALDSFTLEWIFRTIYVHNNQGKARKEKLCKGKTPAWSNFTYEGSNDKKDKEVYSYSFIVDLIAAYFSKEHPQLTPFQAEFVIWSGIQLEMAAEAFYTQAYGYFEETLQRKDVQDFKKMSLEDKLKKTQDLLQKHCK